MILSLSSDDRKDGSVDEVSVIDRCQATRRVIASNDERVLRDITLRSLAEFRNAARHRRLVDTRQESTNFGGREERVVEFVHLVFGPISLIFDYLLLSKLELLFLAVE